RGRAQGSRARHVAPRNRAQTKLAGRGSGRMFKIEHAVPIEVCKIAHRGDFISDGRSCSTTSSSEVWTFRSPLYSIRPNCRNLFMKKLTRERVVPIMSARV